MIRGKNIICVSSIDWDFLWQGHQEIMSAFADHGNKVLFIENTGVRTPKISDLPRVKKRLANWFRSFKGIRKERDNIFIYSPVILPFPYSGIAAFFNRMIMLGILRRWMKAVDFKNPVIWTFLPTRTALDLISNINNELSVYYCIADFDVLVKNARKLRRSEKAVLSAVDLVFAQGAVLKERCLRYNKDVTVFPFGVRRELFDSALKTPADSRIPKDLEGVDGAKIGYVGGLHRHVDYGLIEYLARERPDWKIVLIGPDQVDYAGREKPGNIMMLGMKKYEELPGYIGQMDACIIPYEINEYTKTVYPTKLSEYLFIGKPVISTPLAEVEEFNRLHGGVVEIACSGDDFLRATERAISDVSVSSRERRKLAAMGNMWESRIEDMSRVIEDRIREKEKNSALIWKGNLVKIYRASKRRMLKVIAIATVLYIAVFYSPLVWFLAGPLNISQPPQKADAIVVFGGGVGESGSPGKSTIERARFSVDLYRAGYSSRIIYSSGYTYKYNDAENMKIFAISMGVPKENIVLEGRANSTYENVKYTSEILRSNNLHSAIVVSSPYNMRRAAMTYGHIARDIKVTYVPVPDPEFYRRETRVSLAQINAIVHEYLAILYYILRGYA